MKPKKTKPIKKPTYKELEERMAKAEEQLLEAAKRIRQLEVMIQQGISSNANAKTKPRPTHEQLPLFDEPTEEASSEGEEDGADPETETVPSYTRKKKGQGKRGRKGLPAHLERVPFLHPVDPSQWEAYDPDHGFEIIDYDTSEELMYEPARYWVKVHKRPVVAFTNKDGETCLATCAGTQKVFDKCMASPEILARIAVDRLDAALTLYRIERAFRDGGCPLSRGTLCTWMKRLGELLRPIAQAQMRLILDGFKIHLDDTNVAILVLGAGSVQQRKVWVFIGGDPQHPQVTFSATPARTAEVVQQLVGDYEGFLQVDACGVYDALFRQGKTVEVGCWSHVFRKFEEVSGIYSHARMMLRMIGRLCDIEEMAASWDHQTRYIFRQLAARPILAEIKEWVEEQRRKEFLESNFKKALNYVHNQWEALNRYLEDGRLRMDNNPAEGEFHVFGVTRRNHLFWGKEGLDAGLVLLGLIRTCRLNGINPYDYLCDVIHRVTQTDTPARQLIPTYWKQHLAATSPQPQRTRHTQATQPIPEALLN